MPISVNHNLMAANTARTLNTHYGNLATSTQRLSSGLRITSSADDAAGLAIRELMRADIAALNQGIRNANDAISMLQVADGALGIIDEKLIRMKELAEQAATGTYDSTQRLMIDSEFQAMASEIQRIATATDFNGIKLLDGNTSLPESKEIKKNYTKNEVSPGIINTYAIRAVVNNISTSSTNEIVKTEYLIDNDEVYKKTTVIEESTVSTKQERWLMGGGLFDINLPGKGGGTGEILNKDILNIFDPNYLDIPDRAPEVMLLLSPNQSSFKIVDQQYEYVLDENLTDKTNFPGHNHYYHFYIDLDNDGVADYKTTHWSTDKVEFKDIDSGTSRFMFYYERNDTSFNTEVKTNITEHIEKFVDSVKIHFGAMNDSAEDYYYLEKRDCTLKGLGLEDVRIETQDNAQKALITINDAIVKKDQARAYYGAMQNRLENTVSNLTIQSENLQASESRISDVDVATEMTNFVRNQILTQSAVAMLSQANSMPQMAMQLIGG